MTKPCRWVLIVLLSGLAAVAATNPGGSPEAGGGNNESLNAVLSADGRYVAFQSAASNLIAGDRNNSWDVFVRDRQSRTTELISASSAGVQGNADSTQPSISADGRFVAFSSFSDNLVPGGTNHQWQVFVRDRTAHTTEMISVSSAGEPGNHRSETPSPESISADGRYVVFQSDSTNLVAGDTVVRWKIYVRDRQEHTTRLVSVSSAGAPAGKNCHYPSISADGRFVTFQSAALNLTAHKDLYNGENQNIFLRDLPGGTTEMISISAADMPGDHSSANATISAEGRYVAFLSSAVNLIKGEEGRAPDLLRASRGGELPSTRTVPTVRKADIYVRDRQTGVTRTVSLSNSGQRANHRTFTPFIAADGGFVVFASTAGNLVPVGNSTRFRITSEIYLRAMGANATERISEFPTGVGAAEFSSGNPSLSADGRFVAFHSVVYPQGTRNFANIYVRDRQAGTLELITVAAAPAP